MELLKKNARSIYFIGLILLAIALPLSKFLTGLASFVIVGAWLVEGNFSEKLKRLWADKVVLILCTIYLMHLVGLLYTTDFTYAFNDLRIKLPLLFFPVILGSSQALTKQQFVTLLRFFVAAVIVSTFISTAALLGFLDRNITQARDISFLISHIRLALLICLAAFILLYFFQQKNNPLFSKIVQLVCILWLLVFLFILESFTGIIVLLVLTFLVLSYQLFTKGSLLSKLVYLISFALISIGLTYTVINAYSEVNIAKPINWETLDTTTVLGNKYVHVKERNEMENGNYVFSYLCFKELDSVWQLRSNFEITGLDKKQQPLRVTLMRFLTSKGLRKDAGGVAALSIAEIKSIENGITNLDYQNMSSPKARLKQIFWEISTYQNTKNPSGHSVTLRFEYLKTGFLIVKEHLLLGVGTGDVNAAFQKKYDEMNSPIQAEWRLRAHNQFLTFAVTFGIWGLLLFLFSLLYPIWIERKNPNYLYLLFCIIAIISMFTDDTLETQAGVTFYAFFNALFWVHKKVVISAQQIEK
jgi:hypothetical protein